MNIYFGSNDMQIASHKQTHSVIAIINFLPPLLRDDDLASVVCVCVCAGSINVHTPTHLHTQTNAMQLRRNGIHCRFEARSTLRLNNCVKHIRLLAFQSATHITHKCLLTHCALCSAFDVCRGELRGKLASTHTPRSSNFLIGIR